MFRINSGLSLSTYRSSFHALERHSARVAEGKRIRSAADDAAGLSIATKMSAQIRSSRMYARNLQDQLSMLQTADGALGESIHLLHRLRELAVQAGSVLTAEDKAALFQEASGILDGLRSLASGTTFNGKVLLGRQLEAHSEQVAAVQDVTSLQGLLGAPSALPTSRSIAPGSLQIAPNGTDFLFRDTSQNRLMVYKNGQLIDTSYNLALNTTATWAKNGNTVVFHENTLNNKIVTLNFTGTTYSRTTLLNTQNARLSPVAAPPDSSTPLVAYASGSSQVTLLNLNDPNNRLTFNQTADQLRPIAFDASGTKLYMAKYYQSSTSMLELTVEAGQVTGSQVGTTRTGASLILSELSADGRYLANVTNNGELYVLNTTTGTELSLGQVGTPTDLAWTDDGHILTSYQNDTVMRSLDGATTRQLVDGMGAANIGNLAFSGGNLVYTDSGTVYTQEVDRSRLTLNLENAPIADTLTISELGGDGTSAPADIAQPSIDGATLSWDFWTKPLTDTANLQVSYEYTHTWYEDVTGPLLTDGASTLSASNVTPEALGLTAWIDPAWSSNTGLALQQIDAALQTLSSDRATIGAWSNRLQRSHSSQEISTENLTSTFSQISDADLAWEIWQAAKAEAQFGVSIKVIKQAASLRAAAIDLLFTGNLPAAN